MPGRTEDNANATTAVMTMRSRKFMLFFYSSYGYSAESFPKILPPHQLEELLRLQVLFGHLPQLFGGNCLDDPHALFKIVAVQSVEQDILPTACHMEGAIQVTQDDPDREVTRHLQLFFADRFLP